MSFCAGALVTTWATGNAAWPRSRSGIVEPDLRPQHDPTGLAPITAAPDAGARPAEKRAPAGQGGAPRTPQTPSDEPVPLGTAGAMAAVDELRARDLRLPVEGVNAAELRDTFADARDQDRQHEALDVPAQRNTPVLAADDGIIAKLFTS